MIVYFMVKARRCFKVDCYACPLTGCTCYETGETRTTIKNRTEYDAFISMLNKNHGAIVGVIKESKKWQYNK